MARRSRRAHNPSSESEFSDQESVGDNRSDTGLTEFEDDTDSLGDASNAAFADNEHSAEYYI